MLIVRYGCAVSGFTLHAPVSAQGIECRACPVPHPMPQIPKFGPIPGTKYVEEADSPKVVITFRLTRDVAGQLDAQRGDVPRSTWIRTQLEELLDQKVAG